MESFVTDDDGDADLDPRIQVELEHLNNATDEINRLEIELDEANTTFRLLLNESTRRLKLQSRKLGSCIERARPYYEALEVAKQAQQECQRAAVQFQRANEIHQAAKETVALAEQRFLSKQHEWQFDNAWQEMLNHATIKVRDAENQKTESEREHQKRAKLFNVAEQKVQQLEQKLRRSIIKSRPYFDEKTLCQGQLAAQKERVETLQDAVSKAKYAYANTLKELERISEEIHYKRRLKQNTNLEEEILKGPREPGVGAEISVNCEFVETKPPPVSLDECCKIEPPTSKLTQSLDTFSLLSSYKLELDQCDLQSIGSMSAGHSSAVSEKGDSEAGEDEEDLEELKQRVRELAARPVEVGDGQSHSEEWETELNNTVNKLDHLLLMQECGTSSGTNSTKQEDSGDS